MTSRRRGAGTADAVSIRLIGSEGSSEDILLDTQDCGFERGSHKVFTLAVPPLGTLRRVHIQKHPPDSPDAFDRGWFLKQVEIQRHGGETTIFPCNSWLGISECGAHTGACERNLLPAATDMLLGHHEPIKVSAAGLAIPLPEKIINRLSKGVNKRGFGHGGEDAYFFCEGRHQLFGMGVADGVYGWRDVGIDSGLMSQGLMRAAMEMIEHGVEDVFKVLDLSTRHILAEGLKGSCTASLVTINQSSGQLHAANLGDSGFMVLGKVAGSESKSAADLEVKFRTSQLEHEFGRPYQIGHHEYASSAEDADLVSFYLSPGDIVVMGSDGLLDNLNDSEIKAVLSEQLAQGAGPSKLVHVLVKHAFDASVDKKRDTPYARDASEAFNMVYSGGKPDDITAIVAVCR